ncbi:MAG: hypothetical protein P1V81_13565 [Planctomycetota bacterium]|nr:hypothetical protein [Planctomycetota bacterium]
MSSSPPSFLSPKTLAQAIGVSESSVKRWADDGRIRIQKTSGGHRRIPVAEAARFVREQGIVLVEPERLGLVIPPEFERAEEPIEAALRRGASLELQNLLTSRYLAGEPLAGLFDGPMAAALRQIGELWRKDPRGIFLEHRACAAARDALVALARLIPSPTAGAPTAVGGAISGDTSQLPSMMVSMVLANEGLRAVDLGPDSPAVALIHAAEAESARLVWVSINHMPDESAGRAELRDLAAGLGERKLVIGGATADRLQVASTTLRIQTMAELAAFGAGLAS